MNFTAYIERQKSIIRDRHTGETFLVRKGEVTEVCDSEKLLKDLASLKGLNTRERMKFNSII